jgi:hypothetical protein
VRKDCSNGGGGGSNELVNSTIPHSPLIYHPGEETWTETWRKCNDPRFYQFLGENFRFCFARDD